MLAGLVEKLLVEGTVKLLSITPKNYSNGMDACRKKLELFLLVWCRLYVARQTYTIFQGAYLIRLINPICDKYSLHAGKLIY